MDEEPLFPITSLTSSSTSQLFHISDRTESTVQEPLIWLSNASFTNELLPGPTPVPDWYVEQQVENQKKGEDHVSYQNADTILASSSEEDHKEDVKQDSGGTSAGEKRKRSKERSQRHERKKDRKRKKSGGHERIQGLQWYGSRGDSRRWVEMETKDFQFDARGDRDNLVYESLYRKHVPLFYRHQIRIWSSKERKPIHSLFGFLQLEEDAAAMDEKLREARYWSAKFASVERKKDFTRLKILLHASNPRVRKSSSFLSSNFIPLEDPEGQLEASYTLREESWEGYVHRKTKEFNQLTRERPQDESLWIAFANFQDELIKAVSKKAAIQQAMEKKIAVLEKALEMHSFSEDLWLLFLDASCKKDMASSMLLKWENAIKHIPGSYKLWRGYIRFRLGDFSLFKVSSIRKVHIQALQVFSAAHNLKDAEKIEEGNRVEIERNLVSLFVELCRFEWQTGHHEFAIGLLQAQIEFNIFPPPLDVSERSKKRLFKEFWDSGAPRVGEDGAIGWVSWLQKEEEWIKKAMAKDQADDNMVDEEETGGWTGWYEPVKEKGEGNDGEAHEDGGQGQKDEEDAELKNLEDDETVEVEGGDTNEQDEAMLLERLGLSFDAGQELEVKDPATWRRWSEKEEHRDSLQWLPVRLSNLKETGDEEGLPEAEEEDAQLQRAVLFEDIQDCLFSLRTAEGRLNLICQFTDFCNGPYPQWCCSNSSMWKERVDSLEHLFGPLLTELESAALSCEGASRRDGVFQKLVGGVAWMQESDGRSNFLANSLLLLRPFFPQTFWLQEKLLTVEAQRTITHERDSATEAHGPRALARRLLRNDRQAILLSGAYACVEALAGNFEMARKVFDTTLASLSSLPTEIQVYSPILYQAYAEIELSSISSATQRESIHRKVIHILSCLGSGIPYTPFRADNPPMGTQILKAKRGFREHLQSARKKREQADFSDQLKSFIVCAAIFELLADGLEAAALVFEESFAMSLPGKRQQSLQFELLHFKYIHMMEEHKQILKPMLLRRTILHGLAQYPNNAQLLGAYIRCSACSACTNDVRRFFDDLLQRNPSTVLWLFAISIELKRLGSGPRIHSLFEKALETVNTQQSVVLWRCYMVYELQIRGDMDAARRIYFRAIHACPWSKMLWLDGFKKMGTVLSAKELSDFQEIMREKELRLRTDVYEILLEDEAAEN